MKRSWIGLGLLGALLAVSLWVSRQMAGFQLPLARQLEQSAVLAMAEDWESAIHSTDSVLTEWEKRQIFCAAFTDHTVLEEAEGCFSQLGIFGQARDAESYAALCRQTACLLKAISDAQQMSLKNLF